MTRGGMRKSLPAPLLIASNQIKLCIKMAWFIHPGPEPNILVRPSSSVNKYVHDKYAYNYEGGGSSLSCFIEFEIIAHAQNLVLKCVNVNELAYAPNHIA